MSDSGNGLSMFNQIKTHKIRFLKSCLFYAGFFKIGLCVGIIGPSLIDLAVRTETDLTKTSLILPFRAGGYVVGSFFCPVIYERANVLLICAVTTAAAGLTMLIVPFLRNVWAILALFFIQGNQFGINEAAVNIYIMHLWGKEVTPFMQALHFFFGLGALLAPLFTRPFLLPIEASESKAQCFDNLNSTSNSTFNAKTNISFVTTIASSTGFTMEDFGPSDVQLVYPFCIVFIFSVVLCICFITMYIYVPITEPHPTRLTAKANTEVTETTDLSVDLTIISPRTPSLSLSGSIRKRHDTIVSQKFAEKVSRQNSIASGRSGRLGSVLSHNQGNNDHQIKYTSRQISLVSECLKEDFAKTVVKSQHLKAQRAQLKWYQFENPYKALVIVMTVVCIHVYYGLELTFGSFLSPFSVNSDQRMDSKEGAKVSSIFWAAFTFWRLITVFYIGFTGPKLGILINLAILAVGNIIMIPFGYTHTWALYAGVVLIGFGISPLWGSMFGFLESYFPVTSKIAASMMSSAAIGEFIMPAILAKYMDCQPIVFIYITLATSALTVCTFAITIAVCHYKLTPSGTNEPSVH